MTTPAAKRRRIDAASHTLSKPFRSPFKTAFKSPLTSPSSAQSTSTIVPQSTADATDTSVPTLPALAHTDSHHALSTFTNTPIRTSRAKRTFSSPLSAAALNADPDIAGLLRTQRELEKTLREVKEELEMADQAKNIETESKKNDPDGEIDGELVELTEKWKLASRQAAEELFGKVRDRVNRMGGPRAWKEMQKRQQEFQNGWDQEDQKVNDASDEEDGDEKGSKRDVYAEYDIDLETENEKSQRAIGKSDMGEGAGQEDEFTMAMMLRTLNVDLKTIGYDREQQRWEE